jgi:hypothetical protein
MSMKKINDGRMKIIRMKRQSMTFPPSFSFLQFSYFFLYSHVHMTLVSRITCMHVCMCALFILTSDYFPLSIFVRLLLAPSLNQCKLLLNEMESMSGRNEFPACVWMCHSLNHYAYMHRNNFDEGARVCEWKSVRMWNEA